MDSYSLTLPFKLSKFSLIKTVLESLTFTFVIVFYFNYQPRQVQTFTNFTNAAQRKILGCRATF